MMRYFFDQIKKVIYFLEGMYVIKRISVPKGNAVFSCGGIGDSLYVALLIDEYFIKENMEQLTLYIQEDHKDIIELCNIEKVEVMYYKKEDKKALYYYLLIFNKIKSNYKYKLLHPQALDDKYEELSKYNTLEETYKKYVFGLDETYKSPRRLNFKQKDKKPVEIKTNSILVMPVCNSIPSIKTEFWVTLIRSLVQRYNVYINDAEILNNLNNIRVKVIDFSPYSIADLFVTAPMFKYIISVRSGMCDLLAKQACNMIVLYPYSKERDLYQMFAMDRIPHVANLTELQDKNVKCRYLLEQILEIV